MPELQQDVRRRNGLLYHTQHGPLGPGHRRPHKAGCRAARAAPYRARDVMLPARTDENPAANCDKSYTTRKRPAGYLSTARPNTRAPDECAWPRSAPPPRRERCTSHAARAVHSFIAPRPLHRRDHGEGQAGSADCDAHGRRRRNSAVARAARPSLPHVNLALFTYEGSSARTRSANLRTLRPASRGCTSSQQGGPDRTKNLTRHRNVARVSRALHGRAAARSDATRDGDHRAPDNIRPATCTRRRATAAHRLGSSGMRGMKVRALHRHTRSAYLGRHVEVTFSLGSAPSQWYHATAETQPCEQGDGTHERFCATYAWATWGHCCLAPSLYTISGRRCRCPGVRAPLLLQSEQARLSLP